MRPGNDDDYGDIDDFFLITLKIMIMMVIITIIMFIISSISLDFHGRLEAESQAGATRRMKQEACRYLMLTMIRM